MLQSFYKSRYSVPIFILITAAYLFGGLFTGYPLFTHETPHLYYRIFEYRAELAANGFPPNLFPNAMQEGGFAFPMYYPPFSYVLASCVSLILRNYIFAVHFTFFLSVFASSLTVYYCFKSYFGASAALLSAIAYMLFPYRFVEIFVRGALAESWSFFWFPLVFSGGLALVYKKWYAVPFLAISVAGLLITHSVVGMYFLACMALLFSVVCVVLKRFSAAIPAVAAMAIAIGLMSFYFIPQQMSWDLVLATEPSHMIATPEMAAEQGPDWAQLFFTNPAIWNDLEVRATYPDVLRDGMSFELGLPYPLIFALILFTGTARYLKDRPQLTLFWTTCSVLALSMLYLGAPKPFLQVLPEQFSFVQFPWRVLGLTCFFSVTILGFAVQALNISEDRKQLFVAAACALFISTVNPIFKVPVYDSHAKQIVDKDTVVIEANYGLVPAGEFLPRGYKNDNLAQLARREIVAKGPVTTSNIERTAHSFAFSADAATAAEVVVPLISYPVWDAQTKAGQKLQIGSEKGLIKVALPQGKNEIMLSRVPPPGQRIGLLISLLSLVVLAFFSLFSYKRYKRSAH